LNPNPDTKFFSDKFSDKILARLATTARGSTVLYTRKSEISLSVSNNLIININICKKNRPCVRPILQTMQSIIWALCVISYRRQPSLAPRILWKFLGFPVEAW